jgi:hypothetical protein
MFVERYVICFNCYRIGFGVIKIIYVNYFINNDQLIFYIDIHNNKKSYKS